MKHIWRKNAVYVLAIALLLTSFSGVASATVSSREETDYLSCWRTSSSGYIYTPVSLTARVLIDADQPAGLDFITMHREDLIGETLSQYWASFPNASLQVGNLNIRGTTQSLPNVGSYLYDPNYQVVGRYNSTYQNFDLSYGSSYGQSLFFVVSGGYQTNNTATVNFTW